MDELQSVFERTENFLKNSKDFTYTTTLDHIKALHENMHFRVCLVGGFSKGKTRLVNKLLQTDIFPEMAPPTTTLLTEIRHGAEAQCVFHNAQESTQYPLTHETMLQFSVGGKHADAVGTLSVSCPASMLQPSTLLYDTPGVDDVLTQRANVTFKALEACDGAVIVVSAIAPLSLTERAFIDTYLYGRAVPKIALLLTFTDHIPQERLAEQLSFVLNKARNLYPNIEVWCAQDMPENIGSTAYSAVGINAIRTRIMEWTAASDIQHLRKKRDLVRIQGVVEAVLAQQKVLLQNMQGNFEEKQRLLNVAYDSLNDNNEHWQKIHSDFMLKSALASQYLHKKIQALSTRLSYSIRQEGAEAFEAKLRNTLQEVNKELSQDIRQYVENDIADLTRILKSTFHIEPQSFFRISDIEESTAQFIPQAESTSGKATEKGDNIINMFLNMSSQILTPLIATLPLPPQVKLILTQVAPALVEGVQKLFGGNSKNKERQLDTFVSQFFSQLSMALNTSIHSLYTSIIAGVQETQRVWITTQRESLQQAHQMGDVQQAISTMTHNIADGEHILRDIQQSVMGA